jgi:hypothetical protein
MKRLLGCLLGLALFLGSPSSVAGQARLAVDDNTWLQLGLLAQLQFEAAEQSAGVNGDEWGTDFFARRLRIMGRGSVHQKVKFWFSTDVPNAGKSGVPNDIIWNDGFVDFQLLPQINVAVGRFLIPFSPDNRASAGSLLGIDYNLNLLKLPTPVDRAFWRDDGIEVRGVLFGGHFEYRGGVFRGARTFNLAPAGDPVRLNNPDHLLRTTGMAMINLGDAQPGWFYNPNSLGALTLLSVGAGYDRIPNSTVNIDNSHAWNVFALVEQPVGKGRVNALAAYYDWEGPAWGGGFEGNTMGVQVGYLLPVEALGGKWQPVVRLQRQDSDAGLTLNTVNLGLNYLLKGHAINVKLDYAIDDRQVGVEKVDTFRCQTQLLF